MLLKKQQIYYSIIGGKIMQRTVKGVRITYAKTELTESGDIAVTKATIDIPEKDEKKAIKMATKQIGLFNPLKVEPYEQLYILDDDIFFKYARVATEAEAKTATEEK